MFAYLDCSLKAFSFPLFFASYMFTLIISFFSMFSFVQLVLHFVFVLFNTVGT